MTVRSEVHLGLVRWRLVPEGKRSCFWHIMCGLILFSIHWSNFVLFKFGNKTLEGRCFKFFSKVQHRQFPEAECNNSKVENPKLMGYLGTLPHTQQAYLQLHTLHTGFPLHVASVLFLPSLIQIPLDLQVPVHSPHPSEGESGSFNTYWGKSLSSLHSSKFPWEVLHHA